MSRVDQLALEHLYDQLALERARLLRLPRGCVERGRGRGVQRPRLRPRPATMALRRPPLPGVWGGAIRRPSRGVQGIVSMSTTRLLYLLLTSCCHLPETTAPSQQATTSAWDFYGRSDVFPAHVHWVPPDDYGCQNKNLFRTPAGECVFGAYEPWSNTVYVIASTRQTSLGRSQAVPLWAVTLCHELIHVQCDVAGPRIDDCNNHDDPRFADDTVPDCAAVISD